MNTSALPPASICRASTELAANEVFTATPDCDCQLPDNSPSTSASEAAANTSSSGRFDSCAPTGSAARQTASTAAAPANRRNGFFIELPGHCWMEPAV